MTFYDSCGLIADFLYLVAILILPLTFVLGYSLTGFFKIVNAILIKILRKASIIELLERIELSILRLTLFLMFIIECFRFLRFI